MQESSSLWTKVRVVIEQEENEKISAALYQNCCVSLTVYVYECACYGTGCKEVSMIQSYFYAGSSYMSALAYVFFFVK